MYPATHLTIAAITYEFARLDKDYRKADRFEFGPLEWQCARVGEGASISWGANIPREDQISDTQVDAILLTQGFIVWLPENGGDMHETFKKKLRGSFKRAYEERNDLGMAIFSGLDAIRAKIDSVQGISFPRTEFISAMETAYDELKDLV